MVFFTNVVSPRFTVSANLELLGIGTSALPACIVEYCWADYYPPDSTVIAPGSECEGHSTHSQQCRMEGIAQVTELHMKNEPLILYHTGLVKRGAH